MLSSRSAGLPFKIVKKELEFYRQIGLPAVRRHPDQRYLDRFSVRKPRKLWCRNCDKCKKPVEASFAPGQSEKINCEECYLKHVY